ncbi:helix-turn-helix domain-containing protein [Novosphingobium sp.]|uniref:helix-turn-helix domain-containing protein n=1 Tax=Novosphingobium sp. TaxID=1874826 RepID=UPI002B45BCEA|nr:helix-turn-helix domain-containing protein [Novosphingobium sp.]HKR91240.1 helix-turn-helix domain-containing protein [Novosphingobium sp.]
MDSTCGSHAAPSNICPLFPSGDGGRRAPDLGNLARTIVAQIARRPAYLDLTFEDPQWLMILDLFIAAEEGVDVSISTLFQASGVPPSTALRHIRSLEAKGIFERISHPSDGRVSYIRLSAGAQRRVGDYLASIAQGEPANAQRSVAEGA